MQLCLIWKIGPLFIPHCIGSYRREFQISCFFHLDPWLKWESSQKQRMTMLASCRQASGMAKKKKIEVELALIKPSSKAAYHFYSIFLLLGQDGWCRRFRRGKSDLLLTRNRGLVPGSFSGVLWLIVIVSKTWGEVGTACGNGMVMGSVLPSNDETLVIIELNLRGREARVPSFYSIFEDEPRHVRPCHGAKNAEICYLQLCRWCHTWLHNVLS